MNRAVITSESDHQSRILEIDGLPGLAIGLVPFYHYFSCTAQYLTSGKQ